MSGIFTQNRIDGGLHAVAEQAAGQAGDVAQVDTVFADTAAHAHPLFADSIMQADTLSPLLDGHAVSAAEALVPVSGAGGFIPATAEEVFGRASTIADGTGSFGADPAGISAITDNYAFGAGVLVCFIAYCLIVYYFRGYVAGIFNIFRGPAYTEKALGEHSRVYDNFLGWTIALGTLALGLTALKFVALAYGDFLADALPAWGIPLLVPAAWVAAGVVLGFQLVVTKAAGSLTTYRSFTDSLFYLKKIIFALGTVVVTPLFLLFALSNGAAAETLGWIVAGVAAVVETLLIIRTFMLFVRQNFSISLWFLYLCGVEIFPLSLIWIIAGKIF